MMNPQEYVSVCLFCHCPNSFSFFCCCKIMVSTALAIDLLISQLESSHKPAQSEIMNALQSLKIPQNSINKQSHHIINQNQISKQEYYRPVLSETTFDICHYIPKQKKQHSLETINVFANNNDQKQLEQIYSLLTQINQLKILPPDIMLQISIYATGEIKRCDRCNMNEILYLQMSKELDEFKEIEMDWNSSFKYVYCKDCKDSVKPIQCSKCAQMCVKESLNKTYYKQFNICMECIDTFKYNYCDKCERYYNRNIGNHTVCVTNKCQTLICPKQLIILRGTCVQCNEMYCTDCEEDGFWECFGCDKKYCKLCKDDIDDDTYCNQCYEYRIF
eukprot:135076_1